MSNYNNILSTHCHILANGYLYVFSQQISFKEWPGRVVSMSELREFDPRFLKLYPQCLVLADPGTASRVIPSATGSFTIELNQI